MRLNKFDRYLLAVPRSFDQSAHLYHRKWQTKIFLTAIFLSFRPVRPFVVAARRKTSGLFALAGNLSFVALATGQLALHRFRRNGTAQDAPPQTTSKVGRRFRRISLRLLRGIRRRFFRISRSSSARLSCFSAAVCSPRAARRAWRSRRRPPAARMCRLRPAQNTLRFAHRILLSGDHYPASAGNPSNLGRRNHTPGITIEPSFIPSATLFTTLFNR